MTGIECLNKLSYKVQVKFLKNCASQGEDIYGVLSSEFHNMSEFVSGNFFWDDTSEGIDYWSDIARIFDNKL